MPHGPKKDESTKVTLWYDHISKKVVVETPIFAVEVESVSRVKEMALQLLEEANRLDNYLDSVSRPKRRKGNIPPRYAKKAILDWESDLNNEPPNPNMD